MNTSHNNFDQDRAAAQIVDSKVARLIAIGASMAANNESTFVESVESLELEKGLDFDTFTIR